MPLPVLTTEDDVRSIVTYLKTKPIGATLAEAGAVVKKQVLDSRKISAYVQWGLVTRDGDRLKLSPLGWDLARKPQTEAEVFRSILDAIVPYRSALEWIHHQQLPSVTNIDVAANWHEHHAKALGTDNEGTIKDAGVCFFHLCEAAGLGKLTIGRHGLSTRLDVDREALAAHIEAGPTAPPWDSPSEEAPATHTVTSDEESHPDTLVEEPPSKSVSPPPPERLRVFIAHGKNLEIVSQIETMLELADIDSEVAEEEETPAIPVPDKVLNAMRRCSAGIIAVTVEQGPDADANNFTLNENVLIEIGAAFVLYDRRVVLVWDKRLPVPSNLQGLYRCEFEGEELSWGAAMKLMKAIQKFKN